MNRLPCHLAAFVALVLVRVGAPAARGAEDVIRDVRFPDAPAAAGQIVVTDEQLEQMFFSTAGSAKACRTQLEGALTLKISEIEQACSLGESQQRKLRLAGRGDIARLFEGFDEYRRKYAGVRGDADQFAARVQQFMQDTEQLRSGLAGGLHGADSLFDKTLHTVLTAEQMAACVDAQLRRRQFQHRGRVEMTVALLDGVLALRDEQREALTQVLLTEVPVDDPEPARLAALPSNLRFYRILGQSARIAEQKIRPLLDVGQWQSFNQKLGTAQQYEALLQAQIGAGNARVQMLQNGQHFILIENNGRGARAIQIVPAPQAAPARR